MSLPTEDEQLLRRGFDVIRRAIEGANPEADDTPRQSTRKRRGRLVLTGVAAGSLFIVGLGWLWLRPGEAPEQPTGSTASAQTNAQWIACADLVAVATPTKVSDTADGRVQVDLEVKEWIKPDDGPSHTVLEAPEPTSQFKEPWKVGIEYLIIAPTNPQLAPDTFSGPRIELYRPIVDHAMKAAQTTSCPTYWQTTDGGY